MRRRALAILNQDGGQEYTKSTLANQVFGRDDNSTRAMTTRMTASLADVGLVGERREGTNRVVFLTDRGRHIARQLSAAVRERTDDLELAKVVREAPKEHPDDRPRFHLRHAALLALSNLAKHSLSPSDEHYQQLLLALACEGEQSDVANDKSRYYQLARSWPDRDNRKFLSECIIRFQDPAERGRLADEFTLVGTWLDPGPEAVLWASGAIDTANHLLLEAATPADSIKARGLLHDAVEKMKKLQKSPSPSLRIAALYRIAKAAKILGATDVARTAWSSIDTLELPATTEPDALQAAVSRSDKLVKKSAKLNLFLEPVDTEMSRTIGIRITHALPAAENLFRRQAGPGFARELKEWTMSNRIVLADLVRGRADATLRPILEKFKVNAASLAASLPKVVGPHMNQCNALLNPAKNLPEKRDKDPCYESQLLNNCWTPEMIAVDSVSEYDDGGESHAD